ncbi:MAG: hypothetical protein CM15mP74_29310 [Halieaceae bacterium]|nr:MAG: hypothetical protein CM15mP74_29310 [Halieaceae bacterium]
MRLGCGVCQVSVCWRPAGEPLFSTWGQDRLWLVAHTLRDALAARAT